MSNPYCKVCHDAGKPESEYRNHWVKDRNGNTICPTLLSTKCRYCSKLGHTAKFCGELAKNKKEDAKQRKPVEKKPVEKKPVQQKQANNFDTLDYDSDEEEVEAIEVKEKELTGWAAIAAKPKEEAVVVVKSDMVILKRIPGAMNKPKDEPEKIEPKVEAKPFTFTKSWADLSDSEDEEEDDNDRKFVNPAFYNPAAEDDDW